MKRKTARANNTFLLGSLIMIVLVLVIVILFLFFSLKIYDKKKAGYEERYEIVLGNSTLHSPLTIYLNDSLLFSGTPLSPLTLSVKRFAQESSLLIIDEDSETVSAITLSDRSQTVTLKKEGNRYLKE